MCSPTAVLGRAWGGVTATMADANAMAVTLGAIARSSFELLGRTSSIRLSLAWLQPSLASGCLPLSRCWRCGTSTQTVLQALSIGGLQTGRVSR